MLAIAYMNIRQRANSNWCWCDANHRICPSLQEVQL